MCLTAAPPAAQERRSAGTAIIRLEAFPPSVRIGGAVLVPATICRLETPPPEASEVRQRGFRMAAFSVAPMALPPSWEPWMTDGTAYVIIEEREYIDTWESIAETAIAEGPENDILSARIPSVDLMLPIALISGGGRVEIPALTMSLVAAPPQGIGRPRSPIIQIIAS